MLRSLFALLILFSCLFSQGLLTLDEANYLLKHKDTDSIHKAYQAFKNLRINAIMDSDKALQKSALEGIITSGKLLHIDVSKYREELEEFGVIQVKSKEETQQSAINDLHSVRWKGGNIVLEFKHKLLEKQLHYFILDKKFNNKYRYVFDIKSDMQRDYQLASRDLDGVRIRKNRKNSVRLVIENTKAIPLTYLRMGRELIIRLDGKGKNITQKVVEQQNNLEAQQRKTVITKGTRKRIVIDPGHGGRDSGAVGYRKYREKIIVYQVSKHLKKELEKLGYDVYMTRSSDRYIELRNRTAFANKKNADLFISIHANSVPRKGRYRKHHGVETYFLAPSDSKRAKNVAATENSKDIAAMNYFGKQSFLNFLNKQKILASNKLAIDLQKGMLSVLRRSYRNIRDGGVRKGPFWVLVGAQMPAALVEVGFITSPKEARNLVNTKYQKRLAYGLALGVQNYFRMNQ